MPRANRNFLLAHVWHLSHLNEASSNRSSRSIASLRSSRGAVRGHSANSQQSASPAIDQFSMKPIRLAAQRGVWGAGSG